MQEINVIGLDLANNIFHVYAVNRQGQAVVSRKLRRTQMHSYFRPLPACLIGSVQSFLNRSRYTWQYGGVHVRASKGGGNNVVDIPFTSERGREQEFV